MDAEQLGKSSSFSPVSLTLVAFLLLFACTTPAEGQYQVIGSAQPIVAIAGDDAILPCRVEPPHDVTRLTVEWSKPDLRPDPKDRQSRVNYVHLQRDAREVPDMKISSYIMRTKLFADALRHGNLSLQIINVTFEDEGRYRCFIPKLKSRVQSSVVRLVVRPTPRKTLTTETPLELRTPVSKEETDVKAGLHRRGRMIPIFFTLLIIAGGIGCVITHNCKKTKQKILLEAHIQSSTWCFPTCLD